MEEGEFITVDRFVLPIKTDETVVKSALVQLDETVQLQTLQESAQDIDQRVAEKVNWRDYRQVLMYSEPNAL